MQGEKAFDKVPLRRLINKLYSYKINPDAMKWMKSFILNGRHLGLMVSLLAGEST